MKMKPNSPSSLSDKNYQASSQKLRQILHYLYRFLFFLSHIMVAELAGTVEYTNCISAVGYDAKQSDGETPVMLELWGMQSTPLLPSLPSPLWPGVVAPEMGQIKLFDI